MTASTSYSRANAFLQGLLISALLFSLAESRPRWENPCDLPTNVMGQMLLGRPPVAVPEDLCDALKAATAAAHRHATALLAEFASTLNNIEDEKPEKSGKVGESFKDISFVEGTASHRLNWLPKIDPDRVKDMDLQSFVPYFNTQLQYFAVGIEQIYTDQIVYDGKWFTEFREVEENMAQILCTLQMGLNALGLEANPDVTRDVMRQQYRNIASHSQRLIRNYLILRDYVRLLRVMLSTLEDMIERSRTFTPTD